jgi:hypothetical protein
VSGFVARYYGDDAIAKRARLKTLTYPIEHGIVTNWYVQSSSVCLFSIGYYILFVDLHSLWMLNV